MTSSKPKTLLSFVHNTTDISAYRDEMHSDLRASFERFGIVDPEVHSAWLRLNQAVQELRESSADPSFQTPTDVSKHSAGLAKLRVATGEIFEAIGRELEELVLPKEDFTDELQLDLEGEGSIAIDDVGTLVVVPTRKLGEPRLLLDFVYYFFHFPETRSVIMGNQALLEAFYALGDPALVPVGHRALQRLDRFMEGSLPLDDLAEKRRHIAALCEMLQLEYERRGAAELLRCA